MRPNRIELLGNNAGTVLIYGVHEMTFANDLSSIVTADLPLIKQGISMAAQVPWSKIKADLQAKKYVDVGSDALQDALEVMSPFVPQANLARMIIQLATSIVDSVPGKGHAFTLKDFLKAVTAAEGVDWSGMSKALMSHNAPLAGIIMLSDLAALAAPFIPPPFSMAVGPAFTALLWIGEHGTPADIMTPVMLDRDGDWHDN